MAQRTHTDRLPFWRRMLFEGRGRLVKNRHWTANSHGAFDSDDDAGNAFALFSNWLTAFHSGSATYGSRAPLISDTDHRIVKFDALVPVAGKRVVELGPLEGGHTKQMVDLGASHVLAIEANAQDFVKCLVMKEVLGVDRVKFVYGDFEAVVSRHLQNGGGFDICAAVGVLYHMLDPVRTIKLITSVAPVTYVWSHVATEEKPSGEWITLSDEQGRAYRGKRNFYSPGRHLGGIGRSSVWLEESSLLGAFENRGHEIQMIEKGGHPNGQQVLFVSRSKS
jgi:hypothetical protein